MNILEDNDPRITVHISPYHAWQGLEREMPAWVRHFHERAGQ